jgi:hypothetical protein
MRGATPDLPAELKTSGGCLSFVHRSESLACEPQLTLWAGNQKLAVGLRVIQLILKSG